MPIDHYTNLADYNKFIESMIKVQSTESDKWIDVIKNPDCLVQYPVEVVFQKNKQVAFQVKDDIAMFDITLPKNADYIDTIRPLNSEYSYGILCNGESLPERTDRFVLVACPYTEIKVRLLFNKNNIPDEFGIVYTANLFCNLGIYNRLMYSNFDLDGVKYRNGCILTDPRLN